MKHLRTKLGLTQTEFGKKVSLTHSVISRVESGSIPLTDHNIKLICLTFGITEEWLRNGEGEMSCIPVPTAITPPDEVPLFPDIVTAQPDLTPEKPLVFIPSGHNQHDKAVAIIAGLAPYNRSIYLLGKKNPVLVRAQYNGSDTAFFEPLNIDNLCDVIERVITVVRVGVKDGKPITIAVKLTPALMRAILALSLDILSHYFEYIDGVIDHSTIDATGGVIDDYGYSPATRLFVNCDVKYQPVSLPEALQTIDEIFTDFPFADDASRTHALALFLTFLCKPLYHDLTPVFPIIAPKEGTGKTLLAQAIMTALTGIKPAIKPAVNDDAEMAKSLTTTVLDGSEYLILDNIPDGQLFNVSSLTSAVTSGMYSNRLLGFNRSITAPFNAVVILTGNNPILSAEFARRCVPINLACRTGEPEFRHEHLLEYCAANRSQLLNAGITIVKHWIDAGRPPYQGRKLPSFEAWSKVIGGIMHMIGQTSFLKNFDDLYGSAADSQFEGVSEFLAMAAQEGKYSFTTKELVPFALETGVIEAGKTDRATQITLGLLLKKIEGRIFDGLYLKKGRRTEAAASTWKVLKK